ncbi:MAG: F0F1 ATP synthase subunit epsilon, partial [Nitrosospira sp.]
MNLKILLPFGVFAEKTGVARIVVETSSGSYGLLPNRLDCVAALVPGILAFETKEEGEVYIAVDEGILIKTGVEVLVSVRNAITGADLATLHETVIVSMRMAMMVSLAENQCAEDINYQSE